MGVAVLHHHLYLLLIENVSKEFKYQCFKLKTKLPITLDT